MILATPVQEVGDQSCPTCLVAGANTRAIVAVEVFVAEYKASKILLQACQRVLLWKSNCRSMRIENAYCEK